MFDVDRWISENCVGNRELIWSNGIEYAFYTMKDSWAAIFEHKDGTWFPVIQAETRAWAESYVTMREPVTFPVERI